MNIFSDPLINYIILFSFRIFFSQNCERIVISNLYKKSVILNLSRIVQL